MNETTSGAKQEDWTKPAAMAVPEGGFLKDKVLGAKPYMMGAEPTGLDATAFAFIAGALCPLFETQLRTAAERLDNLRRYVGRMTMRFYPDRSEMAGCKAA